MAWGRRCPLGCESWPDEALYAKCPLCNDSTTRFRNLHPLDSAEARSILLHREFEKFYERRCDRLGISVDGPLPGDVPAYGTALVVADSEPAAGRDP